MQNAIFVKPEPMISWDNISLKIALILWIMLRYNVDDDLWAFENVYEIEKERFY
jgi:hypothetical protein